MPRMFKARFLAAFLILAFVPAVAGQRSAPADVVATDRLARIDKVMQQYVDATRSPAPWRSCCATAGRLRQGVRVERKESSRKMTTDSIFRIASQSKALTSVAILILMEEGVTLATPVSQFIPGFAKTTVAVKTGEQVARSPRSGRSTSRTCSHTPQASPTARMPRLVVV